MKKIIIKNIKGGVGKTTATISLAVGLSDLNKKVLVIDLDHQCDTTFILSSDKAINSVEEALLFKKDVNECISKTKYINVDLLACTENLPETQEKLAKDVFNDPTRRLLNIIDEVKDNYDYCIIDCDPALDLIAINSFIFADLCLVPTQSSYISTKKIKDMLNLCEQSSTEMVIFISDKERNKLADKNCEDLENLYNKILLKTKIRHQSKPCETAIDKRIPLICVKSSIAEDYKMLCKEILLWQ